MASHERSRKQKRKGYYLTSKNWSGDMRVAGVTAACHIEKIIEDRAFDTAFMDLSCFGCLLKGTKLNEVARAIEAIEKSRAFLLDFCRESNASGFDQDALPVGGGK